jgi:hypothetical protein
MLLAVSALKGYAIEATDGPLGTVKDLLFDDATWKIQWRVIDTGSWLMGRIVVIPPAATAKLDYQRDEIRVALTKAEIEASPELSANEPVSQQTESEVYQYYGWDPYWGTSYFIPGAMASPLSSAPYFRAPLASGGPRADPANRPRPRPAPAQHRRSAGYRLEAPDGPIGHVENLLHRRRFLELPLPDRRHSRVVERRGSFVVAPDSGGNRLAEARNQAQRNPRAGQGQSALGP